ncbi:MAG TPA: hypothetical protein VF669_09990 [Tepidisphaeraceae bacterium]|jgi:hypothetical protein
MKHLILMTMWILLLTASDPAPAQSADDSPWNFSLQTTYWYGNVTGYVQTPSGGEPGTSSIRRPRFSEIGINDANLYDIRATGSYEGYGLVGDAEFVRLSGAQRLRQTLISQAVTFPAGTRVSADVQLDWYEIAYRHRFALWQSPSGRPQIELFPSIGVAIFDFAYTLDAAAGPSVDRSYLKLAPDVGVEATWRPGGGHFSLALRLQGTPVIAPPFPVRFIEELTADYQLLSTRTTDLDVFAGIAFQQMGYQDDQTLPNRIRADFGPLATAGLRIHF